MIAMKAAVAPVGEARDDYWIFTELARRSGVENAYTQGRDVKQWLRHIYDESLGRASQLGLSLPPFDEFWEMDYLEHPVPEKPVILFERFRQDPVAHPIGTPSGKIEV